MSLVNESLASALRKVQQESDYKVNFVIEGADDEHKDEHGDVRDVGHVAVVAVADGEVAEAARAGDAGHRCV